MLHHCNCSDVTLEADRVRIMISATYCIIHTDTGAHTSMKVKLFFLQPGLQWKSPTYNVSRRGNSEIRPLPAHASPLAGGGFFFRHSSFQRSSVTPANCPTILEPVINIPGKGLRAIGNRETKSRNAPFPLDESEKLSET